LTEKSVVGVYLIHAGLLRYVNARFAEIMGFGMEEMTDVLGRGSLVFPEDWPAVQESLAKRLSGEFESFHHEFRIVTKKGKSERGDIQFPYRLSGKARVIGTLLDITERKKAVFLVREAEEKYRSIFENAGEGIFQARQDGTLIAANRRSPRCMGFIRRRR
jgi:PAS domain S-box-containing protein